LEAYVPDVTRTDGALVELDRRLFYRISGYEAMSPFFMTLASSSDVWTFISSSGGLTAGRVHADRALFPYYTDDKITESAGRTGGLTILRVLAPDGSSSTWLPFVQRRPGDPVPERSLYKDVLGTTLLFEETRGDLGLRMRITWQTSGRFGVVRTSELAALGDQAIDVDLVDGLVNVLPAGVATDVQNRLSTLLDAYKRTELDVETGLGLFTLSSTLTDLAEPSESLAANVVWQVGLDDPQHLLSTRQLDDVAAGRPPDPELDVRGERGAYLVSTRATVAPGEPTRWRIVGDVALDAAGVVALREALRDPDRLAFDLDADIRGTREALDGIVAATDGGQQTGDRLATMHHAANVLFNDMRGGVPADGYRLDADDVRAFVAERSTRTAQRCAATLARLPDQLDVGELGDIAAESGDVDLWRLAMEYLPLTFSRRHGDPSRPWNRFSIVLRDVHGRRRLDYQGNWRDIFQNWEALAWSYPEYVESMVAVFLDATTIDGYNPYRISRSGVDWEVPEPDDPWSNIGYWGDHQIVYLLKLLETSHRFHPGRLEALLDRAVFTYADVPYRIATYEQTLRDPYDTITFDEPLHATIQGRVRSEGADGRLVHDTSGELVRVSLAEKLLLLALTKLVNLVPEGGVWMNTQRPEWNDANNALVGRGLSVVTTAYLRRYLAFARTLLTTDVELTDELADLLTDVHEVLVRHEGAITSGVDDERRRSVMDELGAAGARYRERVYAGVSGSRRQVSGIDVARLIDVALRCVEATLAASWRDDGLVHSYNVLELDDSRASIRRLAPMLEGQVAALSSGLLSPEQSVALLGALRSSALYRPDQHSYMLYPDKNLAGFLHRNTFSAQQAGACPIVRALVAAGDRGLVVQDVNGDLHFAAHIRNARTVADELNRLQGDSAWRDLVEGNRDCVLRIFEEVFAHAEFTGRSGTFFAYEGLGSIYWHMVSKLLLAVQETLEHAVTEGGDAEAVEALASWYEDIRAGLGYCKTPDVYGAFPADPYSHTPAGKGAKQPGMTGQVKEEVLTRLAELAMRVEDGRIVVRPLLLREAEWAPAGSFTYRDVSGAARTIDRPADSLAFTFCQVPVVLRRGDRLAVTAHLADGGTVEGTDGVLDPDVSASVFRRVGRVRLIEADVPSSASRTN
jgi:hypothetical protein